MTYSKLATFSLVIAATSLSACSTVKLPNLDIFKASAFEEDAKNIGDFPDVSDTPSAPTDVRSAALWDIEANKLLRERDAFNQGRVDAVEPTKSETELARELDILRAKARAYKADDPE